MGYAAALVSRDYSSPTTRENLSNLLNQVLADAIDLHSHAKQAHWHVKGAEYMRIHWLLDTMADLIAKNLDELAVRSATLGALAWETKKTTAQTSRLPEYPAHTTRIKDHLNLLTAHCELFVGGVRHAIKQSEAIDDKTSSILLNEVLCDATKALLIIESHSKGEYSTESNGGDDGHHIKQSAGQYGARRTNRIEHDYQPRLARH